MCNEFEKDVIGLVTPGGDAPGMNAVIYSVTKVARTLHFPVNGILRGYYGLCEKQFWPSDSSLEEEAWRCIAKGGTILGTKRYKEFQDDSVLHVKAVSVLQEARLERLVIVGGNGSLAGAYKIHRAAQVMAQGKDFCLQIIFIPASIDNDILWTESTVGFHSAVATGVRAIDQLWDHVDSCERVVLMEVMGRYGGQIALSVGLAGAADAILLPEKCIPAHKVKYEDTTTRTIELYEGTPWNVYIDNLCTRLRKKVEASTPPYLRGAVVVVAEQIFERAPNLEQDFWTRLNPSGVPEIEVRRVRLAHIQRGGDPAPSSRGLAIQMGAMAVERLAECRRNNPQPERRIEMVTVEGGRLSLIPVKTSDVPPRGLDHVMQVHSNLIGE